jgi:hypothetical protein
MNIFIYLFIFLPFMAVAQELNLEQVKGLDLSYNIDLISSDIGDLDGDSIPEYVLAFNTIDSSKVGSLRELVVLKQNNGLWYVWKTSKSAILGSDDGGVMGDPFKELDIDSNKIFISHFGGSNWRWHFVDSYALIEDTFFLATHYSYWGSFCDEKTEIEFDLFSGHILYSIDLEECGEGFGDNSHLLERLPISESFFYESMKIDLQNRLDTNIFIVSPKNGFEISL